MNLLLCVSCTVLWFTQVHAQVIQRIQAGIEAYGLQCKGVTDSPIKGDKAGNTEFLAHFVHDPEAGKPITVPPAATRDEGGDASSSRHAE